MNLPIFKKINELISNHEVCWLVTVIDTDASTPGKLGMKMLIRDNGEIVGTIGGGTIEKRIIDKTIREKPKKSVQWIFDLGGNFNGEKTGMICGGQQVVFIEPLFSIHKLFIFGGGHCGQALSELAAKCEFEVTIIDERIEWLTTEKHPYATHLIHSNFKDITKNITFSPDTFIAIMTHSHSYDEVVLRQILDKEYKYLGIIASKSKTQTIMNSLKNDGFNLEKLKKIFMPIGFKLGTQTPYEIAVGIIAQMLAVRSEIDEIVFNANPLL